MTHFVECLTEKPGMVLLQDGLPCVCDSVRQGMFSPMSALVQTLLQLICMNICADVKNPKRRYTGILTQEILHTLVGIRNATPAAAVPHPVT